MGGRRRNLIKWWVDSTAALRKSFTPASPRY